MEDFDPVNAKQVEEIQQEAGNACMYESFMEVDISTLLYHMKCKKSFMEVNISTLLYHVKCIKRMYAFMYIVHCTSPSWRWMLAHCCTIWNVNSGCMHSCTSPLWRWMISPPWNVFWLHPEVVIQLTPIMYFQAGPQSITQLVIVLCTGHVIIATLSFQTQIKIHNVG